MDLYRLNLFDHGVFLELWNKAKKTLSSSVRSSSIPMIAGPFPQVLMVQHILLGRFLSEADQAPVKAHTATGFPLYYEPYQIMVIIFPSPH